ncbi:MAG: deoxyribonuclease II family protein [Bryobacteraceae bacterium]
MKQKRILLLLFTIAIWASPAAWPQSKAPVPLLRSGQPVDWWFVFKFNTATFNGCGAVQRACLFGGSVQTYKSGFGQQFAVASSENAQLAKGAGCAGDTTSDPIGATFNQVYTGHYFYVLWNDQFDGSPVATLGAPWGHSKGMMAWDANGNGFVMQVSTPSWPGSGSAGHPRDGDGNTLGCIADDDVLVSQHFFALKLNKGDVVAILKGLANASVVTDPSNSEIVNNGGPADVQALVKGLGAKVSTSTAATITKLSTGVQLISKPSKLLVPTWQLVSSLLGGQSLRAATWFASPEIPTTTASTPIKCWDPSLKKPGAVEIATTGTWNGTSIGLEGVPKKHGNHAKIGVTTQGHLYAIFGDMNQQGTLDGPNCKSSQNGRGGLFYVVDNKDLANSVAGLLKGASAPQ